jgi:F-type H+-transporting ATPase subunit epsilon
MDQINLKIFTPAGVVLEDKADIVILTTEKGEMGILSGHSDLLAKLTSGKIRIVKNEVSRQVEIPDGGLSKVSKDMVEIFAVHAKLG